MELRWEKWTGPVKGYYAYSGEVLVGRVREYKECQLSIVLCGTAPTSEYV